MSIQFIEHYLVVFNPYPSKTQKELVTRMRHLITGSPTLVANIADAISAISEWAPSGKPVLLSIEQFCSRVFEGYHLPSLQPDLFDSQAACFAQCLQANFHHLFIFTIGEWIFGRHSRVEFDYDLYNDVVEQQYTLLCKYALELQAAGRVLSIVDAHTRLREQLHSLVEQWNDLYAIVPIAESIEDERS